MWTPTTKPLALAPTKPPSYFLIRAVSLVAGVWSLGNVMFAGFTYITGKGDTAAHQKVRDYITMSAIGLMLIVASYTVGGILGLVFFGDASFLLNPTF